MRSRLTLPLAALAVALPVATAQAFAPTEGLYHGTIGGTVAKPCNSGEGEGFLRFVDGKVQPIGSGTSCGFAVESPFITAPSSFTCNAVPAILRSKYGSPMTDVNVNAEGFFLYRGTENSIGPLEDAGPPPVYYPRTVVFRGKWVRPGVIRGTTRIFSRRPGFGTCDHTDHWVMGHTGS